MTNVEILMTKECRMTKPEAAKPELFSWNLCSPSPRPSPPGRGRTISSFREERIFSSVGKGSPISEFFQRGHWGFPLLGERVRMRARLVADSIDTTVPSRAPVVLVIRHSDFFRHLDFAIRHFQSRIRL